MASTLARLYPILTNKEGGKMSRFIYSQGEWPPSDKLSDFKVRADGKLVGTPAPHGALTITDGECTSREKDLPQPLALRLSWLPPCLSILLWCYAVLPFGRQSSHLPLARFPLPRLPVRAYLESSPAFPIPGESWTYCGSNLKMWTEIIKIS